jgi:Secretion system C-terminal sorting domain
MIKTRFIFLFLCLCVHAIAQPVIEWQRCLGGTSGETLYSCHQTPDGGFITIGYTASQNGDVTGNHGAIDYWVVKMAADGAIEWKKAYGGSNLDWPRSMCVTSDGGYMLAGYTSSTNGQVSGNHGDKDAWLVKLNANGSIQWQKCVGGSSWDEAWGVKQTQDGGYIMAGRTASADGDVAGTNGGTLDYWIVKLSTNGNVLWSRTFGGSNEDTAWKVTETADGGFVLVGEANSSDGDMTGQHGNGDCGVIKVDSNGNVLWKRMLGGSGWDWAADVAPAADGGCLVVGNVTSNNGDITGHKGNFDIWLVRLDINGAIVYQKTLGGSDEDRVNGITLTPNEDYLIAGSTYSSDGDVSVNDGVLDFWVLKIDALGNILWETTVGGSLGEHAYSVVPASDGGYFAAGVTWSPDSGDVSGQHEAGKPDGWVVKFSANSVPTRNPSTAPLAISPNPAHSTISIQIPDNETVEQFTCFDALGRPVLVHHVVNTAHTIEIATLPPGMYWLQAISAAGKQYMGKFLKE